jgi:hypothetical protein
MPRFSGSISTAASSFEDRWSPPTAYRELGAALGLTTMAGDILADARTGKNGRHALVGMLRQSAFGRLAGYEDVNDAERLRHDPAMRWIVGDKASHARPRRVKWDASGQSGSLPKRYGPSSSSAARRRARHGFEFIANPPGMRDAGIAPVRASGNAASCARDVSFREAWRHRTLKLRALCWVLRRLRGGRKCAVRHLAKQGTHDEL